jgi:hypothetical protein
MLGVNIYSKTFFSATGAVFRIFGYIFAGMKTLIVHPQDTTTTFLYGIYNNLTSKTVITDGITKEELRKHIHDHNRILTMGHGSKAG